LKSAWNKLGYFNVTGSTMPIVVIEIAFEIVIEIGKPCFTMQKIVIEIVIEFSRKILTEISKKSVIERTRLFSM